MEIDRSLVITSYKPLDSNTQQLLHIHLSPYPTAKTRKYRLMRNPVKYGIQIQICSKVTVYVIQIQICSKVTLVYGIQYTSEVASTNLRLMNIT